MITVAQRSTIPMIPAPRGRFTALTVGAQRVHLSALTPRLRSLGATAVHAAITASTGEVPPPVSQVDVCVVESSGPNLREELIGLRRRGWRRVIVVTPTAGLISHALAHGARAAVLPTVPQGRPAGVPRLALHSGEGVHALSDREIQVLQLVAEGRSNRQIGEVLCLSALTVKSHLARVARKLGTGDRAQMVAIGIRGGIVA